MKHSVRLVIGLIGVAAASITLVAQVGGLKEPPPAAPAPVQAPPGAAPQAAID